jgi:hypothetical protein
MHVLEAQETVIAASSYCMGAAIGSSRQEAAAEAIDTRKELPSLKLIFARIPHPLSSSEPQNFR